MAETTQSAPKEQMPEIEGDSILTSTADQSTSATQSTPLIFPVTRVKRIMKNDSTLKLCQTDAAIACSAAAQVFLEYFAKRINDYCDAEGRKTISYKDISNLVVQDERFAFLQPIIPQMMTLAEAMARRKKEFGDEMPEEFYNPEDRIDNSLSDNGDDDNEDGEVGGKRGQREEVVEELKLEEDEQKVKKSSALHPDAFPATTKHESNQIIPVQQQAKIDIINDTEAKEEAALLPSPYAATIDAENTTGSWGPRETNRTIDGNDSMDI